MPSDSPAAGVIARVVDVHGSSPALLRPDLESDRAVADREARSSAADRDLLRGRAPCESKHFVVRAGQRVRARAAGRRSLLTVLGLLPVGPSVGAERWS
jgi:hypothetical protein